MARTNNGAGSRREVIEKIAAAVGQAWAIQCRDELHAENRAAAGGWPGTLSEARAQVEIHVVRELARQGIRVLEPDRSEASRIVYATAKAYWVEHRERDDSQVM